MYAPLIKEQCRKCYATLFCEIAVLRCAILAASALQQLEDSAA